MVEEGKTPKEGLVPEEASQEGCALSTGGQTAAVARATRTPQAEADRRNRRILALLAALVVALAVFALMSGRFAVSAGDAVKICLAQFFDIPRTWSDKAETMVATVRVPRVLGAVLVGAALSVSGASYQGMFKNPIVSPDILGVSSGACVGAATAILLHVGGFETQLFALLGGLAAVGVTVGVPKLFRNRGRLMLVLAGVLVSGFMGSLLSFLKYVADADSELAEIVYWTMGSLASVRGKDVMLMGPVILVALAVLLAMRWRVNLLSLGDNEARSLGVNVKRTRAAVIACSTLLTSTAVCICGTIGWVGLIVPHACRLIVGQDNKNLLPASALVGAAFMLVVDTVCRTLTVNEIPLSIFTGLLGVPLFVVLLAAQRTRLEG